MFTSLKTAFEAYSKMKQLLVLVAVIIALSGMVKGAFWAYKNSIKKEVIVEIEQQEKGIKNEDEKRVKSAVSDIAGVADCIKLGSVYGTDECTKRQDASENDIPETTAAAEAISGGARPSNFVVDRLPLSMGGVFQSETEKQSLCYEESVTDDYGLPFYIKNSSGEWVQETFEVCP